VSGANDAVRATSLFIVTVHWLPFTESHPLHAVKVEPVSATAVTVAVVPLSNIPLHALPKGRPKFRQFTPDVLLDKVPLPVPDVPTVSEYCASVVKVMSSPYPVPPEFVAYALT
jgi:hypothetical protein